MKSLRAIAGVILGGEELATRLQNHNPPKGPHPLEIELVSPETALSSPEPD